MPTRDTDKSLDPRTPTEVTPPRLPKPPSAPGPAGALPTVKPPRMPATAAARPGRRADAPSDIAVTSRLERITVEPTPAPLPPSPAAADADRWFEQVPTNPGAPATNPPRAPTNRPHTAAPTAPTHRSLPAWVFPVLLAVTSLTVGMVLGALLFGRGAEHCATAPPPTTTQH